MEQQEDKIKEEAKQEVVQEDHAPQTENGAVADDKDKKEDKQ